MQDQLYKRLIELYPILNNYRNDIDTILFMLLNNYYKNFNYLNINDLKISLNDNIYLFSAAKTYNIMQNLSKIDENDLKNSIKTFSANEFNKIKVEAELVERISKYTNNLYGKTKMLMNITQEDSKVRDWHRKYNRITLPSNDPFWTTTALKIYGSWNDRCKCIEVFDYDNDDLAYSRKVIQDNKNDKELQKEMKDANDRNENDVIINIKDNRVNCFYQNSLIDNMPDVLRKKYSK